MSLTHLQERKLSQFKDEIAMLEKQVEKQNAWYAVRLSLVATLLFYIVGWLIDYFIDDNPVSVYLLENGWKKPITNFITWFAIYYFIGVKGNRHMLKSRRRELAAYEAKLAKETAA